MSANTPNIVITRLRFAGFTLVELMVTLAVLSIMALMAAPSLRDFSRNQELASVASDFLVDVTYARNQALTRNRRVIIAPTTADDSWKGGWRIFVDVNADEDYDSGTDTLIKERDAVFSDISVPSTAQKCTSSNSSTDRLPLLIYGANGFLIPNSGGVSNGSIEFKSTATTRSRCIVVDVPGRPRMCDPSGGSAACF